MDDIVNLVGPNKALAIFGVKLVGANADNAKKLLFTLAFILLVMFILWMARRLARWLFRSRQRERTAFWVRQAMNLTAAVLLFFGVISIWFDDPTRLTTALGLVTAGLAFALQKVITALAGYVVILRGKTFNVGDRIVMGGVRGDVIALDFTQTSIMEMGQPPPVQKDEPAMWVQSRQYTGRIVTVSNARIFDEPVYNYTRDFPFLWEELRVPIRYGDDWQRVEALLLAVTERHAVPLRQMGEAALHEMQRRYFLTQPDVAPKVFVRLTDSWVEMTVRFIAREHGVRALKDAISRDLLQEFAKAGISLASQTIVVDATLRTPED